MSRFQCEHGFELASFKAVGDEPSGEFEAIVSVFGNVDLGGDRIRHGAFEKSLAQWREKGDPIPVIWNHMWDQPEAHIGAIEPDDAKETDGGLYVKGRIDLDNPFAAQVYRLLSQRRVKEFSFGYNVRDSKRDKSGVNDLLELDVIEVGPTLKGMNPATELLAVKALAAADEAAAQQVVTDGIVMLRPADFVKYDQATLTTGAVGVVYTTGADVAEPRGAEVKAGARYSKETLARLRRMRDELDEMIATGTVDETPKSDEAEAEGKASDPDAEIRSLINLYKET